MSSITTIRSLTRAVSVPVTRSYHIAPPLRLPYKDSQGRETLKPGSNENTKSGRDDDASAQADAAFNPDKTAPETERETAGVGTEMNPLDASGANQEFSKPMGDEKTIRRKGGEKEMKKGGRSREESSQKKGSSGRV